MGSLLLTSQKSRVFFTKINEVRLLMEVFTVERWKNTFPINYRCGHQADCLNFKANDSFI